MFLTLFRGTSALLKSMQHFLFTEPFSYNKNLLITYVCIRGQIKGLDSE